MQPPVMQIIVVDKHEKSDYLERSKDLQGSMVTHILFCRLGAKENNNNVGSAVLLIYRYSGRGYRSSLRVLICPH